MSDRRKLARGVWLVPYLVAGFEALIAVDSLGEKRDEIALRPQVNVEEETARLHRLLDRVDPIAKIV